MMHGELNAAEKNRVLSLCTVFSRVPPAELGVLAEMMDTERLEAGELFFESGEVSDRVCVVAEGRLSVYLPGRARPVRALGRGEILGEYGMFAGMTRTATIKAEEETTVISLDYRRFRAFLLQFPEATLVLLETAVKRLVAAEARGGGEGRGG